MKKFKMFLNLDKEEKWINEMLKKGFLLNGYFLNYRFEKTEETSGVIKSDFRTFSKKSDYEDYKLMFEDSGWKYLAGSQSNGTHFFLKRDAEYTEDIFSDDESKYMREKRYMQFWFFMTLFFSVIVHPIEKIGWLLDPKSMYLTPGLWEKTGGEFWSAFWFETPFVVLRMIIPGLFVLMLFFMIYSSYLVSKRKYKKSAL